MNYERTREVLEALEREGAQYAIFGAVALNMHGLARATEDLDLFIEPTHANIERMKKATVRPKDWGDAHQLRMRFGLED